MTWALVLMLCQRTCIPQYVELYASQDACMEKVDKEKSVWVSPRRYCVPVTKEIK